MRRCLLVMHLVQVFFLYGMNTEYHDDVNPIIPHCINVHNYTKRNLDIFILSQDKIQHLTNNDVQRITLGCQTMWQENLDLLHKKETLLPKQVKQFFFTHFLRYSYTFHLNHGESFEDSYERQKAFMDAQERDIWVEDSSGGGLFASIGSLGIGAKFLATYISKRKKELIEKVAYPSVFDSIHFTLELKDSPQGKLEDSYFFATIVE